MSCRPWSSARPDRRLPVPLRRGCRRRQWRPSLRRRQFVGNLSFPALFDPEHFLDLLQHRLVILEIESRQGSDRHPTIPFHGDEISPPLIANLRIIVEWQDLSGDRSPGSSCRGLGHLEPESCPSARSAATIAVSRGRQPSARSKSSSGKSAQYSPLSRRHAPRVRCAAERSHPALRPRSG